MAATAGSQEDEKAKSGAGSLVMVLGAVVVLSLVAAGGGGFLGLKLYSMVEQSVQRKSEAAEKAKTQSIKPAVAGAAQIKPLAPVVTNLANPSTSWVRLEGSLILEEMPPAEADLLAAKVSEDIIAFLRTVTLAQIEGASGFQHLREDLTDRVKARSAGRARELVIHTFVVE
jgi:flagellar FliL protein